MPGVQLPGEELEGRPLSRVFLGERALPHSIMVNSKGERFANEALAYDQFGAIMREVDPETGTMPNATAWLIFDQNYWDKFGIFGITAGRRRARLPPPGRHARRPRGEDRRRRGGLLRTVDRFNPEARRARDPQFQRGETLFDRYFGAFYPRLGRFSPDARFPAATAKARQRIAAAIGPIVNRLAGRAARKNDPEQLRSVVVGPLARIIRPVLDSPRSSVLGPVDTAPYYALEGRGQRAGHRRRSQDRCARAGAGHRRQRHSRPLRRGQRGRRPHQGVLRRRRRDDLARAGLRLPRGPGSSPPEAGRDPAARSLIIAARRSRSPADGPRVLPDVGNGGPHRSGPSRVAPPRGAASVHHLNPGRPRLTHHPDEQVAQRI